MAMGEMLIVLTFAGSMPGTPPVYQNAANTSRRALMEDPDNKKNIQVYGDNLMAQAEHYTGLNKHQLAYFAYASPIVTHSISTKPFKNLEFTLPGGFHFRPELVYNFGPGPTYSYGLFMVKGF